jgi:hypothetical protein
MDNYAIANLQSTTMGSKGTDAMGLNVQELRTDILPQVVLLPVFLVSLVEELTVLVRLLSVTCADPVACSHQQRSGESGIRRSTLARSKFQARPELQAQNLTKTQAFRNCLCLGCLFRSIPPPRPWSPSLHRPRGPTCHQL